MNKNNIKVRVKKMNNAFIVKQFLKITQKRKDVKIYVRDIK